MTALAIADMFHARRTGAGRWMGNAQRIKIALHRSQSEKEKTDASWRVASPDVL